MVIDNEVFGKLTFDCMWFKDDKILFGEKEMDIVILIAGDEDEEIEEGQYEAYKMLMNKWSDIQKILLEAILDYYKNIREELGYDVELNTKYPNISTTTELLNYITLVGIKIPYAEMYGGRSIGLGFDCTWDEENGLGIRLSNEKVIEVGFQDVSI